MQKQIGIESLGPVAVLYEGDLYELACLLLRLEDAKTRSTDARGRPTVHGLAAAYASLVIEMSTRQVEAVLRRHGVPLDAIIEYDADVG